MSDPLPKTRFGLWPKLGLVFLVMVIAMMVVVLPNRALPLPKWVVVQIEDRLNDTLERSLPQSRLTLQTITIALGRDWVPELDLSGVRLVSAQNVPILTLPEVLLSVWPRPLLQGQLAPRSLRLIGAEVSVTRDLAGKLNVAFSPDQSNGATQTLGLQDVFAIFDQTMADPLTQGVERIEAEALSVKLLDLRSGQEWRMGDGFLDVKNRDQGLAAELQLSLQGQASQLGRVVMSIVSPKDSDQVRVTARIDNIAATDVAAQIAPLAWVGLLNAPMSGRIDTTLTAAGVSALAAELSFGGGVLQPDPAAKPIAFDRAAMRLKYDPLRGRVQLTQLQIDSPALQVQATGHGDLLRKDGSPMIGVITGEVPDAFILQLQISRSKFNNPTMFSTPVDFDAGALDMRLRLDPFSIEIGQLSLKSGQTRISARGNAAAGGQGWRAALDVQVDQIRAATFLGLWPKTLIAGTRDWLDKNLVAAQFHDIRAALRFSQGAPPVVELGFGYRGAVMRALRSLPLITDGAGYGTIADHALTVVLEQGRVTPPQGGVVDMTGSVFRIKDLRQIPGEAEITLRTKSPLTATLSLLDQKPFLYLQKAGRRVDLGTGQAELVTTLAMKLKKVILPTDVAVQVRGSILDFSSDNLVPKRTISAKALTVAVDNKGMQIAGQGLLSGVGFDAIYQQNFGPGQGAQISGNLALSDQSLRAFGIALPSGTMTGEGRADVVIDLARGRAAKLSLTSDLNRIRLAIPQIGWAKPAASLGNLALEATLSTPPVIDKITLQAADLAAEGRIRIKPQGGLDIAQFSDVSIGKWLQSPLDIQGTGRAGGVRLALKGGNVDLRYLPKTRALGAGASVPLVVDLARLRVSDGISLTNVLGNMQLAANGQGRFSARVEGDGISPQIEIQMMPAENGRSIRVLAADAGAVLAAAQVYKSARGGAMDLRLAPLAAPGSYDGSVGITGLRVQNASALAELLNAVSVVGLLDQLSGEGILFNNVGGRFVLTPQGVDLREGAATGGSLGVTMQGVYNFATQGLNMQGTISPVYVLNGIGELIAKRGEGVVGFNYTLKGSAKSPDVAVDLLSVLTPGFLRDIFRKPPATLKLEN